MWKKIERILPWIMLAMSLCFSLWVFHEYGQHFLDSDMSSEFVMADYLNKEGHLLLSSSFYYSTEVRVVSPVWIYQLALMLFPSWQHARLFSIAVMMLLCVAAFIYAAKSAGFGRESVYFSACFVLPISKASAFLFTWGGFYVMNIVLGCVIFGLIMSLNKSRMMPLKYIAIMVFSIWAGLAGVKMLMMFGTPLLICCVIVYLKNKSDIVNEGQYLEIVRGTICSFIFMGIGYFVNSLLLSKVYHFSSYTELGVEAFSLSEFLSLFDNLILFFGYERGSNIVSLSGVLSFIIIFVTLTILIMPAYLLFDKDRLEGKRRILPAFSLAAIIIPAVIICMADSFSMEEMSAGYYICGLFFAWFCLFIYIEQLKIQRVYRTCFLSAMVLFFLADSITFVRNDVPAHENRNEVVAKWLVENEYTVGYASFWNGNVLTELTDGEIEVITYRYWADEEPMEWLQAKSHITDNPEGPVFVYTDITEMAWDRTPCAQDEYLVCELDDARIYIYDNSETVRQLQRTRGR